MIVFEGCPQLGLFSRHTLFRWLSYPLGCLWGVAAGKAKGEGGVDSPWEGGGAM